MRAFQCPFCGSERFDRFWFGIEDLDAIGKASTADLDRQLEMLHEKKADIFVTLTCSRCKAPVRLAREDKPLEVTFWVEED